MTPKQLTYFTAIARAGQFSAAARQLGISQSALSLQMTALEQDLGTPLFRRLPRGVELTEAGTRLEPNAYRILRDLETVRLDIRSAHIEPEGLVRIGIVPSLHAQMAQRLSASLKQDHPRLELEMLTGPSNYLADELEDGRLDLAILQPGKSGIAPLEADLLLSEPLFLMTAPENQPFNRALTDTKSAAITFEALVQYTLLATDIEDGLGYLISRYEAQAGVTLTKRRSYGQLLVDLQAIMDGDVAMILPRSAIAHLSGTGRVIATEITNPTITRDLFLVTDPRREMTSAIKAMMAQIKTLARQS